MESTVTTSQAAKLAVLENGRIEGSLTVTADVTVGDDLTVTDDAAVGGDLAVTGNFACNGSTPAAQAAAITTVSGGSTVDAEARTAINAVLVALRNVGIIDT